MVSVRRGGAWKTVASSLVLSALLLTPGLAPAQVTQGQTRLPFLSPLFSDNMVLQRDRNDPVWGWTAPGGRVTATIAGKSSAGTADTTGKWLIKLPRLPVGGPYTLSVTAPGGMSETRSNILVGDVWLCSGQSNMEFGIGNALNAQKEIADADYPQIRLMIVPHSQQIAPQATTETSWKVCSSETVSQQDNTWNGFSAVGFLFGRDLYQKEHIPIGLIQSVVGGTPAEAWTSEDALKAGMPEFRPVIDMMDAEQAAGAAGWPQRRLQLQSAWYVRNDPGSAHGADWAAFGLDDSSWAAISLPGYWENAGIPSLSNFDGVMWYRKEVDLSQDALGGNFTLHFAADDNDTAWINGVQIGATEGYSVQRAYPVPTGLLKPGHNVIAIRVLDTGGNGGIYGDPSNLSLSNAGTQTVALSGNWRYKIGIPLLQATPLPQNYEGSSGNPAVLYNGMINPLTQYGIKGVLWYQGENNAGRAGQYRALLPTLINDWRAHWGEGKFPFLLVQLAGYQSSPDVNDQSWPDLRDAQWHASQTVPDVGIATAIDVGEQHNIHPKNKQEVARRLALVARKQVYGEDIEDSGPVYKSIRVDGSTAVLTFTHAGGLRTAKIGDPLEGFMIAGAEQTWVPAHATIRGDTVVVESPSVLHPVAVRYAWADFPVATLANGAGLPAFPFRTDDWPLLMQGG